MPFSRSGRRLKARFSMLPVEIPVSYRSNPIVYVNSASHLT